MIGLLLAVLILPACVSNTLETSQFRAVGAPSDTSVSSQNTLQTQPLQETTASTIASGPIPLGTADTAASSITSSPQTATVTTSNGEPTEADRARGVAEIRSKAAAMPDEKPMVTPLPESTIQPMTAQQQKQNAAELEKTLAETSISDAELEAKTAEMLLLKKKAASHYNDAVSGIAN